MIVDQTKPSWGSETEFTKVGCGFGKEDRGEIRIIRLKNLKNTRIADTTIGYLWNRGTKLLQWIIYIPNHLIVIERKHFVKGDCRN